MDIKHNECLESRSLKLIDVGSDNIYSLIKLQLELIVVLSETFKAIFLHDFLCLHSPIEHGNT